MPFNLDFETAAQMETRVSQECERIRKSIPVVLVKPEQPAVTANEFAEMASTLCEKPREENRRRPTGAVRVSGKVYIPHEHMTPGGVEAYTEMYGDLAVSAAMLRRG